MRSNLMFLLHIFKKMDLPKQYDTKASYFRHVMTFTRKSLKMERTGFFFATRAGLELLYVLVCTR